MLLTEPSSAMSLRFFGNNNTDLGRVKILIDDPNNNNPGPPADIGATNVTIEFWMRANAAENTASSGGTGSNCAAAWTAGKLSSIATAMG
jgi:hypothetical protein